MVATMAMIRDSRSKNNRTQALISCYERKGLKMTCQGGGECPSVSQGGTKGGTVKGMWADSLQNGHQKCSFLYFTCVSLLESEWPCDFL